MNYSDIYFSIASVATIAVAGVLLLALFYVLSILRDIKKLSKIARKEAEFIAKSFSKGVSFFGNELSSEASGFIKTLFTVLLSQFARPRPSRQRKNKA